jgi:hypothetical protein
MFCRNQQKNINLASEVNVEEESSDIEGLEEQKLH